MKKLTIIYKNKKGALYLLRENTPISLNEWTRVIDFAEWLFDLSRKENVGFAELMLCVNEQLI